MPNATLIVNNIHGPNVEVVFHVDNGVPALGLSTMDQLEALIEKIRQNKRIRTLTFMGEPPVFAAGGDLKEFLGLDTKEKGRAMAQKMRGVIAGLEMLDIPVIAMLNGDAYGGGVEFALGCDVRFAVDGVKLTMSQCRFGLIPGWGGASRLVHKVGPSRAMYMLFSAKGIEANQAYEFGLVEAVFAKDSWQEQLKGVYSRINGCSPRAVAAAKRAVRIAMYSELEHSLDRELDLFVGLWNGPEHKEGLDAFFSKRQPRWKDE